MIFRTIQALAVAVLAAPKTEVDKQLDTFSLRSDNIHAVLKEFWDDPDKAKPILVNMVMGECTVGGCVKFSKDIHRVAKIVKGQNRVAHVACNSEPEVCSKFPHPHTRNGVSTVYVTKDGVYPFSAEQTEKDLLEYLSENNHKKEEPAEADMRRYLEHQLGLHTPFSTIVKRKFDKLARDAEDFVKKQTKQVPYVDRWTVTSRVLIAAVIVVPPVVFILFWLVLSIFVRYHNFRVDQKYAALN